MTRRLLLAVTPFALWLTANAALAQCAPIAQTGAGIAGVRGLARAMLPWDPDGTGPLGTHLVLGGMFDLAGDVAADAVTMFDPATGTWSTLGNLGGHVLSLVELANGDLVAAGTITIGGVDANGIAKWDGSFWSPLGSGLHGNGLGGPAQVFDMVVRPNGDLIVTGRIEQAGSVQALGIARWDGSAWHGIGDMLTGLEPGEGTSLAVLPGGDVVAGGYFTHVDGVVAGGFARWDGAAWSTVGSGQPWANGSVTIGVNDVTVRANGDLVVCGSFQAWGTVPAQNIARWDGSTWSAMDAGLDGLVQTLLDRPGGDLLACRHEFGDATIERWDGTSWTPFGNLDHYVEALVETNGRLFAAGYFLVPGSDEVRGLAEWSGGAEWAPVASGTNGSVEQIVDLGGAGLLVVGEINVFADLAVAGAAWFDGQVWSAAGVPAEGPATAAVALPDGSALVAFRTSATPTQCTLQHWDGSVWTTVGIATGDVRALAVAPNGDVHAGGDFASIGATVANGLAVFDGTAWTAAAQAAPTSALCFLRDGRLVASGPGFAGLGHVVEWTGGQWLSLGGGLQQPATGIVEQPDGSLVAIGGWTSVSGAPCRGIARWNGATWNALGTGLGSAGFPPSAVHAVAALPNGDVLAAGSFETAGGIAADHLARWNGTAWQAVGSGADGDVASVAVTAGGTMLLGGSFLHVDGELSAAFARIEPSCPAQASTYGAGCIGSAGPVTLHNEQLAWAGGVLRSRVDGVPSNAFVLGVLGLGPVALPLPTLLSQGVPGCSLLASPDLVDVVPATAGSAVLAVSLPRASALIGAQLYQQALPLELVGATFALTATNGIATVVGGMW